MKALPLLTADIPGCGGTFKATPEDFEVEELPAYEPNGEQSAEHLFLWVEKRGRTTQDVAKALAKHCGISESEVSWAGLKDKNAVTRQYLCAPARKVEPHLTSFAEEGVRVLRSARHRNKLKTGHLQGNRFILAVRGIEDAEAARATLERLSTSGLPNYFGEQRFGARGDNAARGKHILLAGGRHRDRFERKLFLSAYQSELFNGVLGARIASGTFLRALQGDVLKKHATGGEFICAQPQVDQPRVEQFEVSPTGPLFGPDMRSPEGDALEVEQSVLRDEGISAELFAKGGRETQGARRLLRVPLTLEAHSLDGDVLRLQFTLPAGSYATVLLGELLKRQD